MKKFYSFPKIKAFILAYTMLTISLIISFILLSQLLINSKLLRHQDIFKYDISLKELDFLDNILSQELKNIEMYMLENKIDKIENFFDVNSKNNKIYILNSYEDRISLAGYKILDDSENLNYPDILKEKLKENFKDNINLHFKKIIQVENENYIIFATINYKTDYSKRIEDLKDEKLKRIWIKKDD